MVELIDFLSGFIRLHRHLNFLLISSHLSSLALGLSYSLCTLSFCSWTHVPWCQLIFRSLHFHEGIQTLRSCQLPIQLFELITTLEHSWGYLGHKTIAAISAAVKNDHSCKLLFYQYLCYLSFICFTISYSWQIFPHLL